MGFILAGKLLHQVIVMFLLVAAGYWMARTGKISRDGSKNLGNILIYLSLPCVIIRGFQVEYTADTLPRLVASTLLAALILFVSAGVARLVSRRDDIGAFAGAFSNPSFFGVPLITAYFPESAVFYITGFVALLNLGQWTYGVSILSGEKVSFSPRKILTAPFTAGIAVGLFFLLTGLPIPYHLNKCIGYIAGLNTPLAMFTIGIYMTKVDFWKMFRRVSLYRISFSRLVLSPLLTIAILAFLPQFPDEMRYSLLIAAACPVGSNIAVYADLLDKDYPYSVQTVVISAVLSIVTIPLIVLAAGLVWG